MAVKNKSPAKKIRNMKRLLTFIQDKIRNKRPNLAICSQGSISLKPVLKFSISRPRSIDIPPRSTVKSMLLSKCVQTDFPQPILKPPETPCPPLPVVYDVFCPDDDYDTAEARQREAERQENVKKTLQMIEDALGY